jgi:uncharacterized protein YjbK
MGEHLEVELKWALDAAGHAALAPRLEGLLGSPRILEQDNRFFDSADRRLRRAKLNLRLRRENDRLLLTCKGHLGLGASGEHRHTEWEEWLDPAAWAGIDRGELDAAGLPLPEAVRQALAQAPLVALGGFRNHRLEFRQDDAHAALLCLDRTEFPAARIDHELEIETASPRENAVRWRDQLREWGIPWREQPVTKFMRFLSLAQ